MEITEKEFAVIREISSKLIIPDQRTIARRAGISVGLTNLIIKRLIKKGYIKAKELDRKKIQYILTPKGFGEKAKKSYNFTLKSIHLVQSIREKIQDLLVQEYQMGASTYCIVGNNELADIAELVLKSSNLPVVYTRNRETRQEDETVIVISSRRKVKTVNLIHYLMEREVFS